MKNLLKFEFGKLIRQKSFYICTAVMLVLSYMGLLLEKTLAGNPETDIPMPTAVSSLLSAINSSDFTMICGIFVALFACADYDQQTIKNVYSRGFSRNSVYFSKFFACIFSTLVMFVVILVFNYVAGAAMFGRMSQVSGKENYAGLIAGQVFYCVAYSSFVFAVSLTVKKVGVSVALAILGPSLIGVAINLADAFLKTEKFRISSYWLSGFADDLTSLATDNARISVCIVFSIVYAIVFIVIGCLVNRKQER